MKKVIVTILCLCLVLPLFGCGSKDTVLQVGFGRADISPYGQTLPLRGYGNAAERFSGEIADPLYATCVAFTDENGNTVLLYHMDLGTCYSDLLLARRSVTKATGVPSENIMISATHTHSAPEFQITKIDGVADYIKQVQDAMVEAATAAMSDRRTAKTYRATASLENMNFCRHYRMNDGSVAGDNFGSFKSGFAGHVVQADNELQILRFVREDAKDVLLVNWQAHPLRASTGASGNKTIITADFVGPMRSYVEANMDCSFAYFSGATGNLNPYSRISAENVTADYKEQGEKLGEYTVVACGNMTAADTHDVRLIGQTYTAKAASGDRNLQINAFSIGDAAFVCAPYEMFSENGQQIKTASPFDMTFIVTYANGGNAYIASESTYAYGGYEVDYYQYEKGTAEALVSRYISMLNTLHDTK